MKRNSVFYILFVFCSSTGLVAQTFELQGQITADSNLEGIHVINKTSKFYATTNQNGAFIINAKLGDTLIFTSIQYKLLVVTINQEAIKTRSLTVALEEFVNQLDEVYVGNRLTGNLEDDIKISKAEPQINFYDVGIQGYKGKPLSKNERLLKDAGEFKPKMLIGTVAGLFLPLNPILNGISGRTKKLKENVRLEKKDALMHKIKNEFSEILISEYNLQEEDSVEFFLFCSEDERFMTICSSTNGLEILEFLLDKLDKYNKNKAIKPN